MCTRSFRSFDPRDVVISYFSIPPIPCPKHHASYAVVSKIFLYILIILVHRLKCKGRGNAKKRMTVAFCQLCLFLTLESWLLTWSTELNYATACGFTMHELLISQVKCWPKWGCQPSAGNPCAHSTVNLIISGPNWKLKQLPGNS